MTDKLPSIVQDALDSPAAQKNAKYVLCVPFRVDSNLVEILGAKPGIVSIVTTVADKDKLGIDTSKLVFDYSSTGKPDPSAWSGADTLLFVGFTATIPYGMLTSALRAGVKRVVSLINDQWAIKPTWALLAERHLNGGLKNGLYRAGVHKLDQLGSRQAPFRKLAQLMNGRSSLADYVAAIPEAPAGAKHGGIAFYTGSLGSGGAERQMVNTILAMVKRGIGPIRVVCAGDPNGFYRSVLDAAGVRVEMVNGHTTEAEDYPHTLSLSQLRAASKLSREVLADTMALSVWLTRTSPEILHCWQDHCNVIGGLAGLLAGVPRIVLSTRSVAPYNFGFFQLNQRPAYQAFAARPEIRMLNNSAKGAIDYAAWIGLPNEKFEVIRNGVDLGKLLKPDAAATASFRHSLGIPADADVMGTIFTIYKFKRPLLWVDTAAEIAKTHPDAHFLIIGDGPMRQETERRIADHGLTKRFHLPGRMEDVALALSAMQAFLLTSSHEGLPNVLLEAQMMGVPVVTVDVGGASEAVDDGVTGVVVKEASPLHLAKAVSSMLKKDQRMRSAEHGPGFVSARFGMERMVSETLAAYGLASDIYSSSDPA